jgi:hypothetical protein
MPGSFRKSFRIFFVHRSIGIRNSRDTGRLKHRNGREQNRAGSQKKTERKNPINGKRSTEMNRTGNETEQK